MYAAKVKVKAKDTGKVVVTDTAWGNTKRTAAAAAAALARAFTLDGYAVEVCAVRKAAA